jgi:transcriptional regulator with XRE-family HTH domain
VNEIKLSRVLVSKRHEKGITQDELAAHVGVTKAAVSKWEKELSFPDITLLPVLAAYYNLSIDELLSYSPQLSREDTRALCLRLSADFAEKPFDEALADCSKIIRKYYSCFPLLYQMAVLFLNHHMLAHDQVEQDKVIEKALILCDRIMSESGDVLLSKDATYLHGVCSLLLRKPEDVFALVGESARMHNLAEDSLISQAFQLSGNIGRALEVTQCGIYQHMTSLAESLLNYTALAEEEFDTAEVALLRTMGLIGLFNLEKLNPDLTCRAYLIGASLYCRHGREERALDCLEKYVDLCLVGFFPFKLRGDEFFTVIDEWLDSCEIGSSLPRDEQLVRLSMLHALSAFPSFALLEGNAHYKQLVCRLTDFANTE